jgi:hypothetical protein
MSFYCDRNCTLTTLLFPANIAVMSLQVGELQRQRRSVADGGIYTQVWFGSTDVLLHPVMVWLNRCFVALGYGLAQ